jgi:hypothetical protein
MVHNAAPGWERLFSADILCLCGGNGRKHILEKVASHHNVRVMFVESICDNEELLEANYRRCVANLPG